MAAFVLNLYLGDVNPGTVDGIKFYNKAIEAPDEKPKTNRGNVRDVQS